jgi:YegS/Rv2252/BmrU family lipid kinase
MNKAVDVIINSHSGTASTDDAVIQQIKDALDQAQLEAQLHVVRETGDLGRFIKDIAANGSALVAAAGGDGTVSAVAAALAQTDKQLGVIPLGTLNNFSKDLGIPQEAAGAIDVLVHGEPTAVDVGMINGRHFINNSSIGLYPRIVRHREQQQRLGRGKWLAAAWAAIKVLRLSHFLTVSIRVEDKEYFRKTPFVFVGNNDYEMDLYNIGRRPRLDEGKLCVYFLRRGGRWGVIVMLLKTFLGRVKQWDVFEELQTEAVTIISKKKSLSVALDGEVTVLQTPLEYKIIPKGLHVMVPKQEDQ